MKLLTLNVHSWQEENQLEKIRLLAETIHNRRYDAVALQEVSQHKEAPLEEDGRLRADNYGLMLKNELVKLGSTDYELYWDAAHYGYVWYEEGVALLVRHPAKQIGSFYLTSSRSMDFWKTRKIIGGEFLIDGQPVGLYSCHLGWWEDQEEPYKNQVDRLIENAGNCERFVLMGDFNSPDVKKGEGYDYLLGKGLYDTHRTAEKQEGHATIEGEIAGWSENLNGLKIDYIFTNWPSKVKYSKIIFDGKVEPVISDHFGIETELD
ncbi:endonuclease/exonuclease/phosphatase family protein [Salipaludibacillus sp. CUR1]|uniref:endonuclease/exonuclease/phosphatase family protein n=1 Tax=Salipaludibacillus sp. CUR1 TaxID=2820003 RepID=UPI001E4B2AAA|nr:endonuclease/exonuclease/phosphatase family protein [Salipaludibacillus sp. CUR1]MCE7791719.1 endonuclease/exonuclease/phosphatase family protein [Salipaludibacillus sp. CUR1]